MAHMHHRPRTTRIAAAVAGAAVTALALTACGGASTADPAAGGEPVTLEFWGWVPGLEDAVATWNADNPDIQVEFHRMTGDDGATIPPAIDAGTAPDVFQLGSANIPEQIVAGRLLDIGEYVTDVQDAYDATGWAAVSFGDGVYGLPQDVAPSGMLYRTDIFDEYGIAVPTTFEEYLDAGRALKEADPDLYLAQLSPNEAGFWMQQVWQAGGSYVQIEDDSWVNTVDGPQSQEVAELWQAALDEELFRVVEMWTPEYWAAINDGSIATINYVAWFPALLKENAGDLSGLWAVAPSPRIGDADASGSGAYGANVVPQNAEHPEQAVEFAKWLNTSEQGLDFLIAEGGIFPAALDGLEHPALLTEDEYFGGQAINEVFLSEALLTPPTFTFGPTHNLTQDALKDNFARVANGDMTFAEALTAVADAQERALLDAGLSVR